MSYIPVLILMAFGATIGIVVSLLTTWLGPKISNKVKNSPFECGVPPIHDTHRRFSVKFYLVAILFLLFDVEAVFFFPFAVSYKKYLSVNGFIVTEMAFFVGILLVGYYYVLKKGALDWD